MLKRDLNSLQEEKKYMPGIETKSFPSPLEPLSEASRRAAWEPVRAQCPGSDPHGPVSQPLLPSLCTSALASKVALF